MKSLSTYIAGRDFPYAKLTIKLLALAILGPVIFVIILATGEIHTAIPFVILAVVLASAEYLYRYH